MIESGKISESEQDNILASPAPKNFKEDCHISWNQPSIQIHNFILGLSPYPGAYAYFENKIMKICKSYLLDNKSHDIPGRIFIGSRELYVNTEDSILEICKLHPEGKKRMSA